MSSEVRNPTYYDGDLRRDLLDAALALIAAGGPSGLSLRAVARKVGVSHAAPKNHFADKTAMFTALAAEGFNGLGDALHAAMTSTDDPVAAFRAAGVAYIHFAVSHPAHFRVMWRNDLHTDDAVLEAAGQQAFDALTAGAERAKATGWADGVSARDLVVVAWSSVHGLAQLAIDGPLPEMDGRDVDTLADVNASVLIDAFDHRTERPDTRADERRGDLSGGAAVAGQVGGEPGDGGGVAAFGGEQHRAGVQAMNSVT